MRIEGNTGATVKVFSVIVVAVMTACIVACVCFVAFSFGNGFPSVSKHEGYFICGSTPSAEYPSGTLLTFAVCAAAELDGGEIAVFRVRRGMSAAEVVRTDTERGTVIVRFGDGGVAAVPFGNVAGKVTYGNVTAGKVLAFMAQMRYLGIAAGGVVALFTLFGLLKSTFGKGRFHYDSEYARESEGRSVGALATECSGEEDSVTTVDGTCDESACDTSARARKREDDENAVVRDGTEEAGTD